MNKCFAHGFPVGVRTIRYVSKKLSEDGRGLLVFSRYLPEPLLCQGKHCSELFRWSPQGISKVYLEDTGKSSPYICMYGTGYAFADLYKEIFRFVWEDAIVFSLFGH